MGNEYIYYAIAFTLFGLLTAFIVLATAAINYQLKRQVLFITNQIKKSTMASEQQWLALQKSIDDSTNEIAAEITSLRDQLKGEGLPADVEDRVFAGLTGAAERLKGIGQEPADVQPVPDTEETDTEEQPAPTP